MNKVVLSLTNAIGTISLFIFINLLINPWTKISNLHTIQGRKDMIIANIVTGLLFAMLFQWSRPKVLAWLNAKH